MFFHPVFMLCLMDMLHERLCGRRGCSVPCPGSSVPRLGVACPGVLLTTRRLAEASPVACQGLGQEL